MSRKIIVQSIIFIAAVSASGKIIASWSNDEPHHHRKIPSNTPFAQPANQQQRVKADYQRTIMGNQLQNSMRHAPINSSLLLPWSDEPAATPSQFMNHSTPKIANGSEMANGNYSQYQAQTQNFTTGIKISGQQSSFICPSNLPYAVGYSLKYNNSQNNTYPNESPTIYARGYKASCYPASDLLYNSNQQPNMNGAAKDLTAFIPSNTPEGCKSGVDAKQPVIFKIGAQTTESPILAVVNNKIQQVGYQQATTVNPPDCNKICNTMLDYYCNAESSMGYCGEIVVASYYITSSYKARQIPEHFCSCSIKMLTWPTPFTNAVDVESAISYNNPLASVTCSNQPAH
jgi:hypothetical protein